MANDADSCVPTQVTDFIFDLSDSVTLSQISEEQAKLYSVTFRELCQAYFTSSPWPSPQSIASECNGHPLFLAIYREVTHRHSFGSSRTSVHNSVEGWSVYRELFEELLDEEHVSSSQAAFYLLPDWCFDILHEFVYQFQGFCQFRLAVFGSAKKHNIMDGSASDSNAPHHLVDNLTHLAQNKEAWAVESVFYYLTKLIAVGKTSKVPGYQYLGIFSSIALSRLECLLGDYTGCLAAVEPVMSSSSGDNMMLVSTRNQDGEVITQTSREVVHSVVGARLSYAYHAGISLLMTRRYKQAQKVLGATCSFLSRGFKTGQLSRSPKSGENQFQKTFDRMICLLSILAHMSPPTGVVEDVVLRIMREKHGSQLVKIDNSGTPDGYTDLFLYCAPKFISPTYNNNAADNSGSDCYELQVRHFVREMSAQTRERKLRSYMKLYTSIEISKLAGFNDVSESDFLAVLLSYKNKMRQEEPDGTFKSALDIHYHLNNSIVLVNEAEKQRRFENYFMAQIGQNQDIMKSVESISTTGI